MKLTVLVSDNMLVTCVALFFLVALGAGYNGSLHDQTLLLKNEIVIEGCNCTFPERYNIMVSLNGIRSFEACQIKSHDEILQVFHMHTSDNLGATRFRFASFCNSSILNEKTFNNPTFIYELEVENVYLSPSSNFFQSLRNLTELRRLTLVSNRLTEIPDRLFSGFKNLKEIVIVGNRLRRLNFLSTYSYWKTSVEALTILDNSKEIAREHLQNFTNLKELHLNNYAINVLVNGDAFSHMKTLEVLNLTRKVNPPLKTRLPGDIFRENRKLNKLILRRNSIEGVERETLANFDHLETLDLSLNSLNASSMKHCFKRLANLDTLILENNNLQHLYREFFRGLDNLRTLRLSANRFKTVIDDEPFYYIPKVKVIDLSKSRIRDFTSSWFANLNHLESLNLEFNNIYSLNCWDLIRLSVRTSSKLASINLRGNSITQVYFQSYKSASRIQGNKTTTLEVKLDRSVFESNLCNRDHLSHLNGTGSDLGILLILSEGNKAKVKSSAACPCEEDFFPCSCERNPATSTIFIDCKYKLKKADLFSFLFKRNISSFLNSFTHYTVNVDLSNNKLGDDSGSKLLALFYYLPITCLNLTSNDLTATAIQINWTDKFPKLKTLDLRQNRIESFLSLDLLSLENGTELFTYVEGNPFRCDCEKSFSIMQWINGGNAKKPILDFNKIHCRVGKPPTIWSVKLINLTSPEYNELCNKREAAPQAMLATLIFGSIAICASVVTAILANRRFCKMQHINCASSSKNLRRSSAVMYDAFVSYSHKDEDFVIKVLVSGLENPTDGSPKYRLCLHERDWVAGEWIPDQIVKSVATSRRTIIFLSENFIESFWGTFEFRAAYEQVIQSKEKRLIVVIKDQLPDLNPIEQELKNFVTNNTYLRWGDPAFWKKLREALAFETS